MHDVIDELDRIRNDLVAMKNTVEAITKNILLIEHERKGCDDE